MFSRRGFLELLALVGISVSCEKEADPVEPDNPDTKPEPEPEPVSPKLRLAVCSDGLLSPNCLILI